MAQRVRESHVIVTDDTILPMQAPEKHTPARICIYRGNEEHPYPIYGAGRHSLTGQIRIGPPSGPKRGRRL